MPLDLPKRPFTFHFPGPHYRCLLPNYDKASCWPPTCSHCSYLYSRGQHMLPFSQSEGWKQKNVSQYSGEVARASSLPWNVTQVSVWSTGPCTWLLPAWLFAVHSIILCPLYCACYSKASSILEPFVAILAGTFCQLLLDSHSAFPCIPVSCPQRDLPFLHKLCFTLFYLSL